ncbi:hypothetical protein [Qipengyuania sp. NPDC077563]|uniref:hypothetical protein n=1 Tax=Qipengyuania sp. NPDC077563 TaxID=3364497 RepID=UPI00384B1416
MGEKHVRRNKADLARENNFHKKSSGNANSHNLREMAAIRAKSKKKESSKKSRKKDVFLKIDEALLGSGLSLPADLTYFINAAFNELISGLPQSQANYSAMFDQSIKSLRELPIGLLSEKECPLPIDFLPSGEHAIYIHCRWMISTCGSDDYINAVVAGWPSAKISRSEIRRRFLIEPSAGTAHLRRHASKLAQLERTDFELYRSIVCGRHRSAFQILQKSQERVSLPTADVRLLIAEHGLLWCAHDLQLITARSAKAEENPLETLASSSMTQMKPENVANQARRLFLILKKLIADYTTSQENISGKRLATLEDLPVGLVSLHEQISAAAKFHGINFANSANQIDKLIEFIRVTPLPGNEVWRDILNEQVSENGLPSSFNALWFSGLSATQSVSVSVLRYLQSEQEIFNLIDERDGSHPRRLRKDTAMIPFDPEKMDARWFEAAKDILFMLRRDILKDKDFKNEGYAYPQRQPSAGRLPILKAKNVLIKWGQRSARDFEGDFANPGRTFYLLDVIPEHRLAL